MGILSIENEVTYNVPRVRNCGISNRVQSQPETDPSKDIFHGLQAIFVEAQEGTLKISAEATGLRRLVG